jgi:hypothetical protein
MNGVNYYTYAYLREDKTPYYIGKGTGRRIYSKNRKALKPPNDKSRIIFLKQNLTEEEAFKHERYMIAVFGRKDNGTGILRNLTDGGDGVPNWGTPEQRSEIAKKAQAKLTPQQRSERIRKANANMTLEQRREKSRKTQASRTTEQRSEAARKGNANRTSEQRSESMRKRAANMTPEQRSEIARKISASITPEQRREASRKAQANKTPEQRREAARKANASLTSEQRSEMGRKGSSIKFQCTETGFITNAGNLSKYQRARSIDTSKRVRLDQ